MYQTDGTIMRETDDLATPNRDLNEQWEKLTSKFRTLAIPLVGNENAEATIASILDLENQKSLLSVISPITGASVNS